MNIAIGTKVQRKGSKVIWTVTGHNNRGLAEGQTYPCSPAKDLGIGGATEIHLTCIPKNRSTSMSEWISIDNIRTNWMEVAS